MEMCYWCWSRSLWTAGKCHCGVCQSSNYTNVCLFTKKSKHLSLHFTQHVHNQWRYRHCDNTVGLSLAPGGVSAARSRSGRRRRTQRGEEEGQGSCYRKHGQYSLPVLILPKHHYFKNCFLMVMYGICLCSSSCVRSSRGP